jgi:type VI secretion system protein ImpG
MSFNTYYQDELTWLRDMGREYAKAHPEAGTMLADAGSDPDVERMLEGFAFISGRLRQKLDDELPELTHALIESLWPHYLRPVPALTMVQFEAARTNDKELRRIPRGTPIDSIPVDGTRCRFHTAYDVEVPPLRVTSLALRAVQPASLSLTLKLSDGVKAAQLAQLGMKRLRLHCTGPTVIAAGLHVCLARHCTAVHLVAAGRRIALPAGSVRQVGFAEEDALLGASPASFAGFALLRELFAFPGKFLYVDVCNLEGLSQLGDASEIGLEFSLERVPDQMPQVSEANLLTGCTPAVNLFVHESTPLAYDIRRTEFPVIPSGDDPNHFEVAAVDGVNGLIPGEDRPKPIPQLFSGGRAPEPGAAGYVVRRRPALTGSGIRMEVAISGQLPGVETLSFAVTCTNGRLPQALAPGDLSIATDRCPPGVRFRNLAKPTTSLAPPLGAQLEWRLLAHLGLNWRTLADVETLRSVIDLYDVRSLVDHQARQAHRRLLEGILAIAAVSDTVVADGALMRGVRIDMQLKESNFDGEGDLHLFAAVMDEFFAQYAGLNSFTRLHVSGIDGGLELTFSPRLGRRRLV